MRASVSRYSRMSPPRCGLTTEYIPSSTVSPVKQHALLLEEEAQVVRRVPGRVHRLETELGALDGVALADHPVDGHVGVLVDPLPVGEHLGAGRLHQPGGAGGVVGMRVRQHHPPHPLAHRRADDGVDVARVVGAGVDHRDLVDPDEVRVRARAR